MLCSLLLLTHVLDHGRLEQRLADLTLSTLLTDARQQICNHLAPFMSSRGLTLKSNDNLINIFSFCFVCLLTLEVRSPKFEVCSAIVPVWE